MPFVWFLLLLVFSQSLAVVPLRDELQESGIHLELRHVHGPESDLTTNFSLSFSDILLRDEEQVKRLKSILAQRSKHWSSSKSIDIPLNSGSSIGTANYYFKLGIGTPAKCFSMLVDTGSSLSWIQCKPCEVYCHTQTVPIFDPSASKTYKALSCDTPVCSSVREATFNNPSCASNKCKYTAIYGDSSYSRGYLSQDSLTLSQSQTFPNFVYECGQEQDHNGFFGMAAGLLGLARAMLSMIAQVSSKYGYGFSYCLPTATSAAAGGSLKLGNPSLASSFKFAPMLMDATGFYSLRLTFITVAGSLLTVSAPEYGAPTIIDSGTVITRLPMPLFSALKDAFVKIMSKKYEPAPDLLNIVPCFRANLKTISEVPDIALIFQGGASLNLGVSNIFLQVDDGITCLASISDDSIILGNCQQQTFEVAYDVPNSRIGSGLMPVVDL